MHSSRSTSGCWFWFLSISWALSCCPSANTLPALGDRFCLGITMSIWRTFLRMQNACANTSQEIPTRPHGGWHSELYLSDRQTERQKLDQHTLSLTSSAQSLLSIAEMQPLLESRFYSLPTLPCLLQGKPLRVSHPSNWAQDPEKSPGSSSSIPSPELVTLCSCSSYCLYQNLAELYDISYHCFVW